MILVFHWQFNAIMFLALQHSTYAVIHDLVARCFWRLRLYCYLFLKFLRPIQGENLAWSTAIVPVFYRRFHGRGRHLGSGANTVKLTVNARMGKIVILMLDNSRKFDILLFL